jgi:RIO kinase 1
VTKGDPYFDGSERYEDEHEYYERLFSPLRTDRRARRKRRPVPRHIPKKPQDQIVAELADPIGLEGGFNTTYRPGHHEEQWLLSSLRSFYEEELITDVLAMVKGGKEASVYRCEAHPTIGSSFLAAKVYRPRMFRTLRNDAIYRQGRQILTSEGRPVKTTDHRIMRAIGKKTAFGVQVMHTSWLMHEYNAIECLYQAGGAVPKPITASMNAILMSYHGDARMAAPTLNQVRLDLDEATSLFREVLRNVELMLQYEMIHGDLSAYNILYWENEITIIDFPQATDSCTNSEAYFILRRDIERVCDYFRRQGVRCDPSAIMDDLWTRYVEVDGSDRAADMSVLAALPLE